MHAAGMNLAIIIAAILLQAATAQPRTWNGDSLQEMLKNYLRVESNEGTFVSTVICMHVKIHTIIACQW